MKLRHDGEWEDSKNMNQKQKRIENKKENNYIDNKKKNRSETQKRIELRIKPIQLGKTNKRKIYCYFHLFFSVVSKNI